VPFGHLAPDRKWMLGTALDLGLDGLGFEMRLDAAADPLDEVAAAALSSARAAS